MNPTTSINERYFAGLPLKTEAIGKEPSPQPAHTKNAVMNLLLAVAGVVSLLLLLFYVVLIRPLRKVNPSTTANAKRTAETNPAKEPEETGQDGEEVETDDDSTDNDNRRDDDDEEVTTGPGAPRR